MKQGKGDSRIKNVNVSLFPLKSPRHGDNSKTIFFRLSPFWFRVMGTAGLLSRDLP